MVCKNCGKTIPDIANFCDGCGAAVAAESVSKPAETQDAGGGEQPASASVQTAVTYADKPAEPSAENTSGASEQAQSVSQAQPVQQTPSIQQVPPTQQAPPIQQAPPAQYEQPIQYGQQGQAQQVQPAEQGNRAQAPKKSKKHILPLVIAGVVVVLAAAGALTWIFARSTILHAFMGDQKYAVSVMGDYFQQASQRGASFDYSELNEKLIDALPEAGDYDADELIEEVADSVAEVIGTNRFSVTLSGSVKKGEALDSLLKNEYGISDGEIEEIWEELSGLSVRGDFAAEEDSVKLRGSLNYGSGNIGGVIEFKDGAMYYGVPDADGTAYMTRLDYTAEMPELKESYADYQSALEDIAKTFVKYYGKLDFDYESGSITLGEKEINCTVITGVFEDDNLSDMMSDIADSLDSVFPGGNFSVGNIDDSVKLTVESYVTGGNEPLGFKATISGKDYSGEKMSVSLVCTGNGSASYIELKQNKTAFAEISVARTSPTDGEAEIEFLYDIYNNEKATVKIMYSGIGKVSAFGTVLPVGKYSVSVPKIGGSNKRLSASENDASEIIKGVTAELELAGSGSGYKITFGLSGKKFGEISLTADMQPSVPEQISGISASDKIIDTSEEVSGADLIESKLAIYTKLDEILCSDELDAVGRYLLQYDNLHAETEKLAGEVNRYKVYENYGDYTLSEATDIASAVYYDTYMDSITYGGLQVIKLYFDRDGSMRIIDGANESEAAINEMYGGINAIDSYVEVTLWKRRSSYYPLGVSVTRTSSSSSIPSALPDAYSYLDQLYDWEVPNFIDDYAVGTCPYIYKPDGSSAGISAKEKDEEIKTKSERFCKNAESVDSFFKSYVSMTRASLTDYSNNSVAFKVSGGKWDSYDWFGSLVKDGDADEFASFMSAKLPDLEDGYVILMSHNGQYIGSVFAESKYGIPSPLELRLGYTALRGYMEGLTSDGYVFGTSTSLTCLNDKVSADLLKKLNGRWESYGSSITVSDSTFDADKITSFYFSSYSDFSFTVQTSPGNYSEYNTDFDTYISVSVYKNDRYSGYNYYTKK